jgi:hypothetical protein
MAPILTLIAGVLAFTVNDCCAMQVLDNGSVLVSNALFTATPKDFPNDVIQARQRLTASRKAKRSVPSRVRLTRCL